MLRNTRRTILALVVVAKMKSTMVVLLLVLFLTAMRWLFDVDRRTSMNLGRKA